MGTSSPSLPASLAYHCNNRECMMFWTILSLLTKKTIVSTSSSFSLIDKKKVFKLLINIILSPNSIPDNYENLIHFLKSIEAQFHTNQPQSNKPLRVVIRNLHPSTTTIDIASALEDLLLGEKSY